MSAITPDIHPRGVTAPPTIRILVVDHPVFALGLAQALASRPDLDVVGQVGSEEQAVALAAELSPDVVVMDLHLCRGSGIAAIRRMVRADSRVAVLVVSMLGDDDSLFAALRAGARGYILKTAAVHEVERAVRSVAAGDVLLASAVSKRAVSYLCGTRTWGPIPFPELTGREREVLDHVARGYDNRTIASRLMLSQKTIRNYLSSILTKLAIADRSALIVRAIDGGLGRDQPLAIDG